ncbi:MAG: hypothetical protein IK097_05635 [Clostridia bacterium]|nr:hypothetical protein [Clostridia bacterium]
MPAALITVFVSVMVVFMIAAGQNSFMKYRIIEKKKGRRTEMSVEMIKDLIGQNVTISLFNESLASRGVIIAVEDNWVKVEEKKQTRIINGDMIRDIAIVPEKKAN